MRGVDGFIGRLHGGVTKYCRPRLTLAFRQLRRDGFIARQNHMCCSSCAGAAICEWVRDMPEERRQRVQGYVFFHQQDAEALKGDTFRELCIRYGQIGLHPDGVYGRPTVEVGHAVVVALEAQGLAVSWDGDPNDVILVVGLRQELLDAAAAAVRLGATEDSVLLPGGASNKQQRR